MTYRFQISVVTIICCLTNVAISCAQAYRANRIDIDTLNTAVIGGDAQSNRIIVITNEERQTIDSLFIACINNYNRSLDVDQKEFKIDLRKEYKRQLIVGTDKAGSRIVWVNSFCRVWSKINWRKENCNSGRWRKLLL